MKRCPQCNTVFGDEIVYCANDGAALLKETFVLPSESDFEAETIVRRDPIVVDLSTKNRAANVNPPPIPLIEDVIVRMPPPKSNAAKYALFLLIGLLLGGSLVLATLLLTRNSAPENTNKNSEVNSTIVSETPKKTPSPANLNTNVANRNETASEFHLERSVESDDEFNGRVISLNARVRSAPNRNAAQTDILPIDDRLTITDRNDPNGLWFHVVCEHGTSGWMHGNTIEYTK